MSALYIFLLAVGAPLLVWMAFAGDGDGGDGEGPLAIIPLSTIAFLAFGTGFVGVVGGATGAGAVALFVAAVTVGVLGALMGSSAFKWVRKTSYSTEVTDAELEGTIARVSLPVSREHRGRIIVDIAGAREQMTASPADGSTIEPGEQVVIIKIEKGVALVAALGPDLELE